MDNITQSKNIHVLDRARDICGVKDVFVRAIVDICFFILLQK